MTKLANDTRVFKINPEIEVQNVRFYNRYGFILAGHLYLPKNFEEGKKYAAIAFQDHLVPLKNKLVVSMPKL